MYNLAVENVNEEHQRLTSEGLAVIVLANLSPSDSKKSDYPRLTCTEL
jgi:hypothetical protein